MSDERKAQQWKIMGLAGVGGVALIGILGWVMNSSEANLLGSPSDQTIDPTIIADVTSSASPELSWVAQSKSEIVLIPYEQAYAEGFEDMHRRVPDCAKLERAIGFKPRTPLEQIVDDVIADQRSKL